MKLFLLIAILLVLDTASLFAQCVGPNGVRGELLFNETNDVFQVCTERGWFALHEPKESDPCLTAPGQVCIDGSIFVGITPDGGTPMYVTPNDVGTFSWATDSANTPLDDCSLASPSPQSTCITGASNTLLLSSLAGSFPAAEYCNNLSAHGHEDWYLPAQDELNVIYGVKNEGSLSGSFNETGAFGAGYYWSSSESQFLGSAYGARFQLFSNGNQGGTAKSVMASVRCARN